jgi:hypothetical protein
MSTATSRRGEQMRIPEEDIRLACPKCSQPVMQALTGRMSKGKPVTVLVEPDEDVKQHYGVNETWQLSKTGGKYYAGRITNRNQRAAMLEKGIRFHADHKAECGKQPTTRRRYK